MKQKELIIFIPSIEGGGVEKNLFLITNFLSQKYKKIKFITSSSLKKNFNENITVFNKKYIKFFLNKRLTKVLNSSIELFIQLLKNKNCLVLSFQANVFAITLAKFLNSRVIVRLNSSPTGWMNNNLKKKFFKLIYKKSDLIIVNSYDFKKEIFEKFNLKSICIYNPIDKNNIINKSILPIKNPFKKKKSLKIINIGRLVDQKDHLTLLKSINTLKNILNLEVIILGRGVNKPKLKQYIYKNNLKKIIKIIDFKKNPYPFIKHSNLMVLTSKYEGLPNVLLEGIVLKKFIISSNCPTGPREILDNGKGGFLFKTGSHRDLTKKIIKYSKNKKDIKIKINYSYKLLDRFEFKKQLTKYYDEIEKIFK